MNLVHLVIVCALGISTRGQCPTLNWQKIGRMCFYFSTQGLTWDQARKQCQKNDGGLVQFYSDYDRTIIANFLRRKSVENWWTALNDFDHPGAWAWGGKNSQVFAQALDWNVEPDDTDHTENCVTINYEGALSDQNCNETHGYMCEYNPKDDGCPFGWLIGQQNCYYISDLTDPYNIISWQVASDRCKSLIANKSVNLLRLETHVEQAYIRSQLADLKLTSKKWWIGMSDQAQEGHWLWDDGSPVNESHLYWEIEPDNLGGVEHCGLMKRNGRFSDAQCSRVENYICQVPQRDDSLLKNQLGCPINFERAGHKCYFFQMSKKSTWSTASSACQALGTTLLDVETLDEKNWLEDQMMQYKSFPFWTGLNYHTSSNTWYWSSGTKADSNLIRWNSEPNNYGGNEDCGMMLQDGTFNDESCSARQGYICELDSEDMPCPSGWMPRSDQDVTTCYLFSSSNDSTTWTEAQDKCKKNGLPMAGYLLAINDQQELVFVTHALKVQAQNAGGWWTGLNDQKQDGFWQYDTAFNNPVNNSLIPWNSEPNNSGGKDYCAVMYYGGRYNDINCNEVTYYICNTFASVGNMSTSSPSTITNQPKPSTISVSGSGTRLMDYMSAITICALCTLISRSELS